MNKDKTKKSKVSPLVGATRGFVQENKSKNKKMKNYKSSTKIIDFAFGIPAKPKKKRQIITESVKNGLSLGSKTGSNIGLLGGAIAGAMNTKSSNPRTKLIGAMIGSSIGSLAGAAGGGVAGLATGTGIGVAKSLKKKKSLIEKLKNR